MHRPTPRITISTPSDNPNAALLTIDYSRHSPRGHALTTALKQRIWHRIKSAITLYTALLATAPLLFPPLATTITHLATA